MTAMEEGRREEGVELLRNALVAAELNELDDPQYELDALDVLIQALFREFNNLLCSARLHEVLCLCAPR